jgi:PAS domain S-box-containing protein
MEHITLVISVTEIGFGAGAALVGYFAWKNRHKPAGFPVFFLMVAGSFYALINGLGSLTANAPITVFLGHLRWPLGALTAIGVLYVGIEYTNNQALQRREVMAALSTFAVIDALAFITNPFHELLLRDPGVDGRLFVAADGPFLVVHLVLSFALAIVGLLLLLFAYTHRSVHRKQTAAIIIGIGIAIGLFAAESFVEIHPALNIGSVGIIVGATTLVWAINNAGLLETIPVAREALMDNMDDLIIAVDTDNRIIDVNDSTTQFIDSDEPVIGRSADDVFQGYPALLEEFERDIETNREIAVRKNGQHRYFDLQISPITTQLGLAGTTESNLVGRLIVASDITDRRRREEELDLLKQVFARILRHNMRNDLNVIKGNATMLEDRVDEADVEILETVTSCTDNLLEMSEKARDLETIIDSPRERREVELSLAIQRAIADVESSYPDAKIVADIDEARPVMAHRELETAIRNLLENACEHDTDPPTTIEIDVSAEGDEMVMTVEDDGPGIPEHELEVLEAETESSLQHGSGLGLWIVNWVSNRSKATVELTTDDGTRATIKLDRAETAEASPAAKDDATPGEAEDRTASKEA